MHLIAAILCYVVISRVIVFKNKRYKKIYSSSRYTEVVQLFLRWKSIYKGRDVMQQGTKLFKNTMQIYYFCHSY